MPKYPDDPADLADPTPQPDSELAAKTAAGTVLVLDLNDPQVRRVLAAAHADFEYEARRLHPTDLYQQTVVVLGFDPLQRLNRSLTAERFGGHSDD